MTKPTTAARPRNPRSAAEEPAPSRWRYAYLSSVIVGVALVLAGAISVVAVAYAGVLEPTRTSESSSITLEAWTSSVMQETEGSADEVPPPVTVPAPTAANSQTLRPAAVSSHLIKGRFQNVNITFYDCANQGFCGAMYNGKRVYEGAAACSWNMAIGTKFVIVGDPTGRIYSCDDRGLLANTWVDIFFYYPAEGHKWQSLVGRYGTIEILTMP